MSMPVIENEPVFGDVIYPESDGKPMADNLTQSRVIRTLVMGFERLYAHDSNVLVGGDFFWYPVKGEPKIVVAPDVMVVRGTPKVELRSYRQFEHGGQPALAVEVLSHNNTWAEMARKHTFYQRHGVLEYWVFDPLDGALQVFLREGDEFVSLDNPAGGFVSPTTGVQVHVEGVDLVVHDPEGGRQWLTPAEEMELGRAATESARAETARANEETARANEEAARAEQLARAANDAARRAAEAEAEVADLREQLARLRGDNG